MFVASGFAQTEYPHSPTEPDTLRTYLQESVRFRDETLDQSRRYTYVQVDLNEDAVQEVIVYLTGAATCGTGGCTLLILKRDGASFALITRIPATRRPIRVLPRKHNGWYDISVWRQGGGNLVGNMDIFSFDGTSYTYKPSPIPNQLTEDEIEAIPGLLLNDYGDKLFDWLSKIWN